MHIYVEVSTVLCPSVDVLDVIITVALLEFVDEYASFQSVNV